jgi:hypothetical protein
MDVDDSGAGDVRDVVFRLESLLLPGGREDARVASGGSVADVTPSEEDEEHCKKKGKEYPKYNWKFIR